MELDPLSMVAMARNRPHAMLHSWLVAIVVGALVVVLTGDSALTRVSIAFLAAQAVACAWMVVGVVRLARPRG